MKDWIASRLAWMDANLPGTCSNDVVETVEIEALDFAIYPNPASTTVQISGLIGTELAIYSVQGQLMQQETMGQHTISMDVSELPRGMYFVQAQLNHQRSTKKLIIN